VRAASVPSLALAAVLALASAGAAVAADRVTVVFDHPERFTDLRDRPRGGAPADDPLLAELARFLRREAEPRLAPGQTLAVTVTDVDRAGSAEPHGRGFDAVRVVREVTPPRIALAFRLSGPDGAVLKSGERRLTDVGFLGRPPEWSSETLRHEKALIADWLAAELR
jgi:hypothetical protein